MTTDALPRIDARIDPVAGAGALPAAGTSESAGFQRLLESLQKVARQQREAPQVQDAEQLRDALRVADAGFVTAMDLRKKLEEAFHSRLP